MTYGFWERLQTILSRRKKEFEETDLKNSKSSNVVQET